MKPATKVLLALATVALLLVGAVVAVFASAFMGTQALIDGETHGRVTVIQDEFVGAYLIDAGAGRYVLVDCGQTGAPIEAALQAKGVANDAVAAIFLTHAHGDHAGGCKAFPRAAVYALADELPLLHGQAAAKGPFTRWAGKTDHSVRAAPLKDGETVTVSDLEVQAYGAPGHTAGSAVLRVGGDLFFGDSARAMTGGSLQGAPWVFTDDPALNEASIAALPARLAQQGVVVERMYFGHTAPLEGIAPLQAFRVRHR